MDIKPVPRQKRLYLDSPQFTQKRRPASSSDYRYVQLSYRRSRTASEATVHQPVALRLAQADLPPTPQSRQEAEQAQVPAFAHTDYGTNTPAKRSKGSVLQVTSVLLVLASCGLLFGAYRSKNITQSQYASAQGMSIAYSDSTTDDGTGGSPDLDEPSENPIGESALSQYVVAANRPRYLTIDSLRLKSRILRIGTTKAGAVGAPNNIFDTGWYENSNLPGETGSSLIVGHNSGRQTKGVFADIGKLRQDDTVEVTYGSGEKVKFAVSLIEEVALEDVDMTKYLRTNDQESIMYLMTCSGAYDKATRQYSKRTVVKTVKIP